VNTYDPLVTGVVRAAGGVPLRRRGGRLEILLVHRPVYDDWALPKGKCEVGESDEECALREVEEETGLRGSLGSELATTTYVDAQGRPKRVRYWAFAPDADNARPSNEVDAVEWCPLDDALRRLSYDGDREVVRALKP
jgi:8-oxo-dGTP diphosphatase